MRATRKSQLPGQLAWILKDDAHCARSLTTDVPRITTRLAPLRTASFEYRWSVEASTRTGEQQQQRERQRQRAPTGTAAAAGGLRVVTADLDRDRLPGGFAPRDAISSKLCEPDWGALGVHLSWPVLPSIESPSGAPLVVKSASPAFAFAS